MNGSRLTLAAVAALAAAGAARRGSRARPGRHAMKLPAWTTRLRDGTSALKAAVRAGDRAEIVQGIEDVSFWVGRVVCDSFGGADLGGADEPTLAAATEAIMEGERAVQGARRLLEAQLGRRGSRTQIDLPLARPIWPGTDMNSPPIPGERVKVYFNLNAQYNKDYGQVRDEPTEAQIRAFTERRERQVALAEQAGECLPTLPREKQIRGMYASGAVYSVKAKRGSNWPVSAHARAVAIRDVVFTTSGATIKAIRNKRSKTPCCFGDGHLVSHGAAAVRLLQQELDEPHAIVGLNPMRNDTFVVMAPATSGRKRGEEVFTADLAIFTDNPRPRVGSPPGLVYAFGINQGRYRRGKLVRADCNPRQIRGVQRPT